MKGVRVLLASWVHEQDHAGAVWVGLRWWCRVGAHGVVWLSRGGEFFDDDKMVSAVVLVDVPMFPRMGLW